MIEDRINNAIESAIEAIFRNLFAAYIVVLCVPDILHHVATWQDSQEGMLLRRMYHRIKHHSKRTRSPLLRLIAIEIAKDLRDNY